MVFADWLTLFGHFLSLSLLAIGGAIVTAPESVRFLVHEKHWLSELEVGASIAMAQAAPGPNVLFIALLGWHVGLHAAGGWGLNGFIYAMLGVCISLVGILLPSTTFTFFVSRYFFRHSHKEWVMACRNGLAPVGLALLLGTVWALSSGEKIINGVTQSLMQQPLPQDFSIDVAHFVLILVAALMMWKMRVHPLLLILAGAALGILGWV